MTGGNPIEIMDLRKEYKRFVAVDDLTLKVEKNSFTGFLGPNGAGKSTTLKILTNLINATSGSAFINGSDVTKEYKTALIGVGSVVETPEFYLYLTPREMFSYTGEVFGMSRESISAQTDALLSDVKMTDWADKRLGTFSKGMKQRVALGIALMNDPSVVILDEPTSGLDPRGVAEMRDVLKGIRSRSRNLTMLMSSHILHEVADLCDRVALINRGELLLHDRMDAVTGSNKARRISLRTVGEPTEEAVSRISGLAGVEGAEAAGGAIDVRFTGGDGDQLRLFNEVCSLGIGVFDLHEEDALESVYLSLIAESR
ncbi:MAG: ABC transporter ATP-binding protein [Methanomassiliicoccaceae archaeon]|nr:ABC transporter ATP-binding protein [Methanomassiliicoccaceae archaeon]